MRAKDGAKDGNLATLPCRYPPAEGAACAVTRTVNDNTEVPLNKAAVGRAAYSFPHRARDPCPQSLPLQARLAELAPYGVQLLTHVHGQPTSVKTRGIRGEESTTHSAMSPGR